MAFAAFALIAVALPSCGSDDEPTPPHNVDNPKPEEKVFTLEVSDITSSDFSLSVTPNGYTGNYYVAVIPGSATEGLTGKEIAEKIVEKDLSENNDLSQADNEYIYNRAATIRSLRSLWLFSAGSKVSVVVFGVSGTGEILTDVVVESVQLLPLAESEFELSVGQVTSSTAQVTVTGKPGSSFFLGVFTTDALSSFDKNELADIIISSFGADILKSIFTLPDDKTMGTVSFSGLTASTSFTAVTFGFDQDKFAATSVTLTETFTTPAGGDTPVNPGDYAFGTVSVANPTDTSIDLVVIPADQSKPYTVMVEAAAYVDQFASDAELFAGEIGFYQDAMAEQGMTGISVYQLFEALDMLYTGSVEGNFPELDPGTAYCAYAYYMNPQDTLDGDIAKAYFTTTGTATASVTAKARRQVRNYVERRFELPVVLGAAVSSDIAEAAAFGKVR